MTEDQYITLREYLDARWEAHRREHELLQEVFDNTTAEISRRIEEMNQFRAQILDERGIFITKIEHESRYREFDIRLNTNRDLQDERIKMLELSKSNMDGRLWALGVIVTGITILVNIAFRYWG